MSLKRALLVAALAACASGPTDDPLPTPPAAPVFDTQIVAGQRIGPVSLGMSGSQLLQAAGSPRTSNHVMGVMTAEFANGIGVNVRDSDNRVSSVSTRDATYSTAEGLRVGVSELEVRSRRGSPAGVLADPSTDRYLCYPGMWFGITPSSGRVNTIAVTAATACTSNARK